MREEGRTLNTAKVNLSLDSWLSYLWTVQLQSHSSSRALFFLFSGSVPMGFRFHFCVFLFLLNPSQSDSLFSNDGGVFHEPDTAFGLGTHQGTRQNCHHHSHLGSFWTPVTKWWNFLHPHSWGTLSDPASCSSGMSKYRMSWCIPKRRIGLKSVPYTG